MYTDSELPSAFAFIDYHAMTTTFVKNYNLVLIQHFIKQTKLYIISLFTVSNTLDKFDFSLIAIVSMLDKLIYDLHTYMYLLWDKET